jgi:hypothetical protein
MWYESIDDPEGGIPDEWVWERLRLRRDALLVASDWTQVIDAPVDQNAWAEYRQALRDLPESVNDPREVVWPEAPPVSG